MSTLLHKAADPHIDPNEPWKNDDFQREEYGKRLTRLVTNTPGSFVIALKAPWGAGKSIFLKRWEAHLELPKTVDKSCVPVVHVDAWRNDYLEDPMLAFIDAVAERTRRDKGMMGRAGKALTQFAKYGAKVITPVVRGAAAMKSAGATELVGLAAESVTSFAEHWLERAQEHRASEEVFRKNLEKLRDVLCEKPKDATISAVPLVIVIDELDRCRPDFAIKALERIKHFFGVPGIVFVIATDGNNLPNAVRTLYGSSTDGERYLRKYFDYEFTLPKPDHRQAAVHLFQQSGLAIEITGANQERSLTSLLDRWLLGNPDHDLSQRQDELLETLAALEFFGSALSLSLRDLVQATTIVVATIRSVGKKHPILPTMLVLLILLKFRDQARYESVISGTLPISDWLTSAEPVLKTEARKEVSPREFATGTSLLSGMVWAFQKIGAMGAPERFQWAKEQSFAQQKLVKQRAFGLQKTVERNQTVVEPLQDRLLALMDVAGSFAGDP